jgi:hypothetical protein
MSSRNHARRCVCARAGLAAVLVSMVIVGAAATSKVKAEHTHRSQSHRHFGYPHVPPGQIETLNGGAWFWMRSPEQEQVVIMNLYNRYCVRCHGVDGRGVSDIPGVPDFSDARWQSSRTDAELARLIMQGRGPVMPAFRGSLARDEAWVMARHLRSFVPGSEVSESSRGSSSNSPPSTTTLATPTVRQGHPLPATLGGSQSPFAR